MKKFKRLVFSLLCFSILFGGIQAFALSGTIVDYYAGTDFSEVGMYSVDQFEVTGNDVKITHENTDSKYLSSPSVRITLYRWNVFGIRDKQGEVTVSGYSQQYKTFSGITNDDDYKLYIQSVYADQVDFEGYVTD